MASVAARFARLGDLNSDPADALAVSGRGHAFDEELRCSCGTTWFEHQAKPVPCRLEAQRCKRAEKVSPPSGS